MNSSYVMIRDFFLDKKREKAKLEAEMKLRVTLKQVVPAGEAKPVAPLGLILSQYYLNLNEFCDKLNLSTSFWSSGIPLSIKVKKALRAKEYNLSILNPPTYFLLRQSRCRGILNYLQVWDIVRFKAATSNISLLLSANLVFSCLRSSRFSSIVFQSTPYDNENLLEIET